jgi:hypothetical protein
MSVPNLLKRRAKESHWRWSEFEKWASHGTITVLALKKSKSKKVKGQALMQKNWWVVTMRVTMLLKHNHAAKLGGGVKSRVGNAVAEERLVAA